MNGGFGKRSLYNVPLSLACDLATGVVVVVICHMCFARCILTLELLCCSAFSLQCCVFPAAVVLLDSWHVLLRNLWDEHLNHSLILDLKQTLDKIVRKNKNTEVGFSFQIYLIVTPHYMLYSTKESLKDIPSMQCICRVTAYCIANVLIFIPTLIYVQAH